MRRDREKWREGNQQSGRNVWEKNKDGKTRRVLESPGPPSSMEA